MPWSLKRYQNTGQTHFVTFSCYHRSPMLTTESSCRIFESALERVRKNFRLRVYAYVVMPEHIHLLLSEPENKVQSQAVLFKRDLDLSGKPEGAPFKPAFGLSGELTRAPSNPDFGLSGEPEGAPFKPGFGLSGEVTLASSNPGFSLSGKPDGAPFKPDFGLSGVVTLADAIKSLKQGVSRRLIGDATHFWQKRYYDFNIRNHDQFVEKLHYIHQNPVTRRLCARPEDWLWSSFHHHATACEGHVEIESEWTARKRERASGRLCPAVELPHSSQNRA